MKKLLALLVSALSPLAHSALEVGATAPDFTAPATLGGKEFTFRLAEALKNGPVVVYFYPAAFTQGCTVEAHSFAEAMPKYQALGASVIGVSTDDIATLNKFSVSECRNAFPVASDASHAIMKAYDAVLLWKTSYADRVSYVISPDGRIAYRYSAMNPDKHVENTLAAVKAWAEQKK
jgi:thioredoxin-dependent peroxiredoxin